MQVLWSLLHLGCGLYLVLDSVLKNFLENFVEKCHFIKTDVSRKHTDFDENFTQEVSQAQDCEGRGEEEEENARIVNSLISRAFS